MAGYLGNTGKKTLSKVVIGIDGETYQVASIWTGKENAAIPLWRSVHGLFLTIGSSGSVYCSKNGIVWEKAATLPSAGQYYVTYGMDRFVCVENAKAYYSVDGYEWVAMNGINARCYSVTFNESMFVAVGVNGKTFVSTNGTSWGTRTGLPTNYSANNLAVGNGTIVCSCWNNEIYKWKLPSYSWSRANTAIRYMAITFGAGKFVMSNGAVLYSSVDGSTWTQCANLSGRCTRMIYGNGMFVAVSNATSGFISMDGKSWTNIALDNAALNEIRNMSYGAGVYVGVTNKMGGVYTKNGKEWLSAVGIPTTEECLSVAFSFPGGYDAT